MIALDTNVLSELMKREPDVNVVDWLHAESDEIAIPAVVIAELLAGVERLPEGRRRLQLAHELDGVLRQYRGTGSILPFDERAADHYARICVQRQRLGVPIHTADAQIAAICLAHGATLATRNVKDFAGTGVALTNPWEGTGE